MAPLSQSSPVAYCDRRQLTASVWEERIRRPSRRRRARGNLKEAIRLYHNGLSTRERRGRRKVWRPAQLRIGVIPGEAGASTGRADLEAVRDKYPNQPQVGAEAARRLGSTHQREAVIEEPSDRTASESYIHRQVQQVMERAKQQKELTERQLEAIQRQLTEQTERRMEQLKQLTERTKRGTSTDSVFIDEQVRRQLEAAQRQMKQVSGR